MPADDMGMGDFMVEYDATVQRIVNVLKEKGFYENTIIILTSDNGSSPHGFWIEQEIEFQHNTSNGFKEKNLILLKACTGFRLSLEKLMTYEKFNFVVFKIE
ncbi:MAG: sulfatase-like hydrolase/transferase [Draconibacterium sp.]|nr:sulfatase-like hydrolase/transferase [Draconibacterium sp.]